MKCWMIAVLLFTLPMVALAQETEEEKIQQLREQRTFEQQRINQLRLDSAVRLMERGEYNLADEAFRNLLTTLKAIPSDLTFYFGKNSFYLGQYKQSIDWLNKYIQLKGTSGQFSVEATDLLKKSEVALVGVRKEQTKNAVEVFSRDYEIDCGPSGKVVCPVCAGSTVIIRKSYLGQDTYRTCGYCHQKGVLTCTEYNKLLRGQLQADKAN